MARYTSAWGKDFNIASFIDACRGNVEKYIFGGAYADIKVDDLLFGFVSDVASKAEGSNYVLGNYFGISNMTTPIINDQKGFGSNVTFGMYTGSNGIDEIGYLRLISDAAYANKLTEIFNGTQLVNVTQLAP